MHRLRPGDIDVVGGLGDSLVAGSGALEEFAVGTFIEARGVSWCVGGQGDWRRFLTVPNLLKVLNALLIYVLLESNLANGRETQCSHVLHNACSCIVIVVQ